VQDLYASRCEMGGDRTLLVLISFVGTEGKGASTWRAEQGLPEEVPFLVDSKRLVYARYNLTSSAKAVWTPKVLLWYGLQWMKGTKLHPPDGDTSQLGGMGAADPNTHDIYCFTS